MAALETKIVSAMLRTIRGRRAKPPGSGAHEKNSAVPRAKLREATFADFDGVMQLRRESGWSVDSLDNWERIWRRNPALRQMKGSPPIGWVLEANEKIVGYLGNIPLVYHYGNRTLTAVTGSGLVVQPAYRALTFSLNAAFYGQKDVDLYLTTTAVEAVGKIARAFKSNPLPQSDYDSMLFWVLQPNPFACALMKKLGLSPFLASMGRTLASLMVSADKLLRRRWPSQPLGNFVIQSMAVEDIGEEVGALWRQKLQESPRLLADRSPETLRWHFDAQGSKASVRMLCCYKNAELVGYAVVKNEAASDGNGLRRSIIADMLARQDEPAILRALWAAAYDHARQAGSHIFEVLGFPPRVRAVSSAWHPYVRKYPALPFYYKAADPALHSALAEGTAWYASPFDGDTTLWSVGSAS